MEHTKGPWAKTKYANNYEEYGIYAESDSSGKDIAMVRGLGNASLVEAAPTLLEACKGAIAALSQNKTYPVDIKIAKSFLSDAIAKAKGE